MKSTFTRRSFVKAAALAAVGGSCIGRLLAAQGATEAATSPSSRRPNILFLMADDWGFPHSPVYGDKVVETPTFEQLAKDGVLFDRAYCTSPSCSPSRASVLTGQMFYRLDEGANLSCTLDARFAVYPDLLEAAGYFVGMQGKGWGLGARRLATRRTKAEPRRPGVQEVHGFPRGPARGQALLLLAGEHRPASALPQGRRVHGQTQGRERASSPPPARQPRNPQRHAGLLSRRATVRPPMRGGP